MNILLALNDSQLRTTMACLLNKIGHYAFRESTNDERIALINSDAPIDFLLADLNLEPSGAEELVAAARTKYPKLPILLVNGFDERDKRRITEMKVEFIQPPQTDVVLAAAINRTKLLASEITIGNFWQMMALSNDIFFQNYNPSIPGELKARECFLRDFQQGLLEVDSEIRQKHEMIFNTLLVPLETVLMDKSRHLLADLTFWLECQKIKL